MRQSQKPRDTDQEPGDQPKLVASLRVSLSVPGSQQIPKEKITQYHTICTQRVLLVGDAVRHCKASPMVIPHSQASKVFDPENGNRDDHISAPFHHAYQRFFGIWFGKDDQHHYRMPKNFDPSLESHEGKISPGYGNEAVRKKSDEQSVV